MVDAARTVEAGDAGRFLGEAVRPSSFSAIRDIVAGEPVGVGVNCAKPCIPPFERGVFGTMVRVEWVSSVSVDELEPIDRAGETDRGGSCNSASASLLPDRDPGMPGDGIVRAASISRLRRALREAIKFYLLLSIKLQPWIRKTIKTYLSSGRRQFALVFKELLRILPVVQPW